MLLLTNASSVPHKLQLTTSDTCTVDVHASYIDASNAVPPVVQGDTMGSLNTAISTGTTTDIVAAPAANEVRNVKTLHIRNKHASLSVDVTVILDQNGTDFELYKASLAAGESLEYIEGVGFFEVDTSVPTTPTGTATVAQIASHSADTYYLGMNVSGRLQAGSFFRWKFRAQKGAGTATPVYTIRFGTAGTVADTARVTMTGAAQTAVADEGWFEIDATFRAVGSSTAVLVANHALFHRLATTGFSVTAANVFLTPVVSSTFDSTVANSIIGLSVNPGTSGAWVTDAVTLDAVNLLEP